MITQEQKDLLTLKGYFKKFFELLKKHQNHENAFDELEAIFYETFGRNRYKNYESFRVGKSKHFEVYK
jgi:hypothetical protein